MKYAMLLILVPVLASGQGLTALAPGATGGRVLAGFSFATPGCFTTGSGGVDVTRASKALVNANGDGYTLTECQNNEYRVAPDGLLVEPARFNYALSSNTMTVSTAANTGWALSGATTTTVAGAPMGGTWAELTSTSNAGVMFCGPVTLPSSTKVVFSAWMAKASGTGYAGVYAYWAGGGTISACTCWRSDGGSCTATITDTNAACRAEVSDLGTTPVRLAALATGSAITSFVTGVQPGRYGTATGTTRFGGAQLEIGAFPTSLMVSTGSNGARSADTVSATIPGVGTAWCVAVTAKPGEGRAWSSLISNDWPVLWSLGVANANDSSTLYPVEDSQTNLLLYRFSGASSRVSTKALSGLSLAAGSSHRLVACSEGASGPVSLDGADVGATMSGAGTGISGTPPTVIRLGSNNGALVFSGYLKNVKLCAAKSAKGCK